MGDPLAGPAGAAGDAPDADPARGVPRVRVRARRTSGAMLARLGLGYVVVRHDLDPTPRRGHSSSLVSIALARSRGVERVASSARLDFGPAIEIYRVDARRRRRRHLAAARRRDAVTVAGASADVLDAVGRGLVGPDQAAVVQGDDGLGPARRRGRRRLPAAGAQLRPGPRRRGAGAVAGRADGTAPGWCRTTRATPASEPVVRAVRRRRLRRRVARRRPTPTARRRARRRTRRSPRWTATRDAAWRSGLLPATRDGQWLEVRYPRKRTSARSGSASTVGRRRASARSTGGGSQAGGVRDRPRWTRSPARPRWTWAASAPTGCGSPR